MNAVPTNLILAEKEAARTIVASQEKEREKTYQERKTLCAELHKKKIKFYPSASLKELQKLLGKKGKEPATQKPKTTAPPSTKTKANKEEPKTDSAVKEERKADSAKTEADPEKAHLEALRKKAATLGLKPPRLYTLPAEKLEAEITKLEAQKEGSDSAKTNVQPQDEK